MDSWDTLGSSLVFNNEDPPTKNQLNVIIGLKQIIMFLLRYKCVNILVVMRIDCTKSETNEDGC